MNPYVNWTMTFHPGSDFFWPMSSFVRRQPGDDANILATHVKRERTGKLLALVSDCKGRGPGVRMQILNKLKSRLPQGALSIYGKCGSSLPCPRGDESSDCYRQFFQKFDFVMAFENSRCAGYITEKVFRAFEHGMVPIVNGGFGREDYDRIGIPRDSYIHVDDFSSLEDMAKHITQMDDSSYNKFFSWQHDYRIEKQGTQYFCQVCEELAKPRKDQKPDRSFGKSLSSWFFAADKCQKSETLGGTTW